MRFLHTGDWHIGKALRSLRRDDEYREVLAEVLDIARTERVDCLLVAGDIFDSAAPPPEAERIVFDFFRELVGARIPAVVIAGNHDNPRRLGAFARVLELVDIHVVGEPALPDGGGVHHIRSRDGEELAVIAALPWVNERKVRTWEGLQEAGVSFAEYADGVAGMANYLCQGFRPDSVNILLAHLMVDGAVVGGEGAGERALHLGLTYAVKPQVLPPQAHYVALGHLHRQQVIRPAPPVRYAGSLLQLDFGEAGQEKSVTLIEASAGLPARVETIALIKGRRLRDLRGTLADLQGFAGNCGDDFLRVFVTVPGPTSGLAEQVREFLPNALDVVPDFPQRETGADQHADLRSLSPLDLFLTYCRERKGGDPDERLTRLFNRLYAEVASEAD